MQTDYAEEQVSLFDLDTDAGRTCPAPTAAPEGRTSTRSWRSSCMLKNHLFMLLDLRPGAGNMLGPCWELAPVWLGPPGTLNTSECPSGAAESSLSQILVDTAPSRYYLSPLACLGILRRARERGKTLPPLLEQALRIQAGLIRTEKLYAQAPAGFLPESSSTAGNIGFQEETAPTLKAGGKSSAVMLPTLCLNDQGGDRMDSSVEQTGTLRSQEHGHQPLVYSNHGQSTQFDGPISVSTTVTAGYGEGGNNTPLVTRDTAYCIVGNIINQEVQNGGNGTGVNEEVAFTLTATDQHAVFGRQRTDIFRPADVASTESARQHKDATDLIMSQPVADETKLIRRLMPIECERLQGFPDGWTNIPGAFDSNRYKALGNSVAIPCVTLLLAGIAAVLRNYEHDYDTVEGLYQMLNQGEQKMKYRHRGRPSTDTFDSVGGFFVFTEE